jgi:hypothetical protein
VPTPTVTPVPTPTPTPTPLPTPTPTSTRTPTPSATPAPGFARANPADVGTGLFIKVDDLFKVLEARITLFEVIRGEEAWTRIKETNRFSSPPKAGFEYIIAKLRFEYLKGKGPDTKYDLNPFEFTAVSSDGKEYELQFVVGPKPELSASLYPGASHEGWVSFQVAQHDTRPLMTFGRDYQGRGGVWWKLYK